MANYKKVVAFVLILYGMLFYSRWGSGQEPPGGNENAIPPHELKLSQSGNILITEVNLPIISGLPDPFPVDFEIMMEGKIDLTKDGEPFQSKSLKSSKSGAATQVFEFILDPGSYELTETYQGSASNSLVQFFLGGALKFEPIHFTRNIEVPSRARYVITINTTINNLHVTVSGAFAGTAEQEVLGSEGFTIELSRTFNPEEIKVGDSPELLAKLTAQVTSNTQLEFEPIQEHLILDSLSAEIEVTPNTLLDNSVALQFSEGQIIEATVNVTNGSANPLKVQLHPNFDDLGAGGTNEIEREGEPPPRIEIGAFETKPFNKFRFKAIETGKFRFRGQILANAEDPEQPTFIPKEDAISEEVTIQKPPELSATLTLLNQNDKPITKISSEQEFILQLGVTNRGEATAFEVKPVFQPPPGIIEIPPGLSPDKANIDGQDMPSFTWTLKAEKVDESTPITFEVKAVGKDINSGEEKSATDSISTSIEKVELLVEQPLIEAERADGTFVQDTVSEGQRGRISMDVVNTGGIDITSVIPQDPIITDKISLFGPVPSNKDLKPSEKVTFRWEYRTQKEDSAGEYTFIGKASGTNTLTDESVLSSEETAKLTVQTIADLNNDQTRLTSLDSDGNEAVQISADSTKFTVQLELTNTGGAIAESVNVSDLVLPASLEALDVNLLESESMLPPSPLSIQGNQPQTYKWVYQINRQQAVEGRTLDFEATLTWRDKNTQNSFTTIRKRNISFPSVGPILNITASPRTISIGQAFTVDVRLKNTGETGLTNVKLQLDIPPNLEIDLKSVDPASPDNPLEPEQKDILATSDDTVYRWVYEALKGSEGNHSFTVSATGTNQQTGTAVITSATSEDPLTIQRQPELKITKIELQDIDGLFIVQILAGQTFRAIVTVQNGDDGLLVATATDVMVGSIDEPIGQVKLINPAPMQDIPAGQDGRRFTFTYQAEAEFTASDLTFTAEITAGKHGTPKIDIEKPEVFAGSNIPLLNPPQLIIQPIQFRKEGGEFSPDPITLSEGQPFEIRVPVKNEGDVIAEGVSVQLDDKPQVSIEMKPDVQEILNSVNKDFDFTLKAIRQSVLTFTATASGTDAAPAKPLGSDELTIQTPPVLKLELTVFDETDTELKGQITAGQKIIIKLMVDNAGQATAQQVRPQGTIRIGQDQVIRLEERNPIDIIGGSRGTFRWEYQTEPEDADKTATFSLNAEGADANYLVDTDQAKVGPVSQSSEFRLVRRAFLAIEPIQIVPNIVSLGQTVEVSFIVRNQGGDRAEGVVPTLEAIDTTSKMLVADAERTSENQLPPTEADIESGKSATFQWRYTSNETGKFEFRATALGSDTISEVQANKVSEETLEIQNPAELTITGVEFRTIHTEDWEPTISITVEQDFEVRMEVSNNGEADAVDVQATLTPSITEKVTPQPPLPTKATISSKKTHEFIWKYSTGKDSNARLRFDGAVAGKEGNFLKANIEHPIDDKLTSADVVIQTPPDLKITIKAQKEDDTRTTLTEGEKLSVEVTVENEGQATANAVSVTLTPSESGVVTNPSETIPLSHIAGVGEAVNSITKTVVYDTVSTGVITFTAEATGMDANSGNPVKSDSLEPSNEVSIFPPPDIKVTKIEVEKVEADDKVTPVDAQGRPPIGIDQQFRVKVTIENAGAAAVIEPSDRDLNISEPQYQFGNITPAQPEVENNATVTLTYPVRTVEGQTQSGEQEITVETLKVTDRNTGTAVERLAIESKAIIDVDTERPKITKAFLDDQDGNATVNAGDRLIVGFNTELNEEKLKGATGDDFLLLPGGRNLTAKITVEPVLQDVLRRFNLTEFANRSVQIGFKADEPNLTTEGIQGIYGENASAIGIGLTDRDNLVSAGAGNLPLRATDQDAVNIEFEDKHPPEILPIVRHKSKISAQTPLRILVKNDQMGLDSRIDPESFEFTLDGTKLEFEVLRTETGKLMLIGTAIQVEIDEPNGEHPFWTLTITFETISEGKHTFSVTVKDIAGQQSAKQTIVFEITKETIALLVSYPNPFAPEDEDAIIRFDLNASKTCKINIYDVAGRLVRTFPNITGTPGRNFQTRWDGTTEGGDVVGNGIYICELIAGEHRKYWRIAVGPSTKIKRE